MCDSHKTGSKVYMDVNFNIILLDKFISKRTKIKIISSVNLFSFINCVWLKLLPLKTDLKSTNPFSYVVYADLNISIFFVQVVYVFVCFQ